MNDERWKSLLSFVQFILGTVILGVFGTVINHQIQTREVEIKEQEQISKNLVSVLSPNKADKLLMAQFYATVTRSDDIRARWVAYRDELKAEIEADKVKLDMVTKEYESATDAKVKDRNQEEIQQISATITPSNIVAPPADLPARLYFHIKNESQRERAKSLAGEVASNLNVVVPGIQRLDYGPTVNELRFFKTSEATEAQEYVKLLQGLGVDVTAKYIPGFESSQSLRPKHYELWFSTGWR
ncbi:hypothetical protein [Aeromonas enteropelogenes]|uniref:SPOR domain-containing protein n=1 Tax=Aeromonas enteropelogenes TaxID=29489 RepID=A0ABU9J6E9_AEREN